MQKNFCLIIDDEPIARDIILSYCNHIPYIEVAGLCANAFEAKTILKKQKIDLLFLDINMPVLDGIAFLKTIKNPPKIIFTTAYKEYAVQAFDLAADDYLLKPFSLERFIIAVDKVIGNTEKTGADPGNFIFIKADGKIFKIKFDELFFAEAYGNYTKVVVVNSTLLPSMTFSSFEEQLPKNLFLRVHRSFIINKSKITHIEGNRIFINAYEIPIGNNYKEAFLKELGLK
jgi:two-component system LytT family response regulator